MVHGWGPGTGVVLKWTGKVTTEFPFLLCYFMINSTKLMTIRDYVDLISELVGSRLV